MSDLVSWAEFEFSLNKSDDKGITMRDHLLQLEKSTGQKPKALMNPTEFPRILSHVWTYFCQLSNARTNGFSGPNPITYQEISAWKELTQSVLSPRDIECIKALDETYLRIANGGS